MGGEKAPYLTRDGKKVPMNNKFNAWWVITITVLMTIACTGLNPPAIVEPTSPMANPTNQPTTAASTPPQIIHITTHQLPTSTPPWPGSVTDY